jgi:hypothetical protein
MRLTGQNENPMLSRVPPTYDWDVVVNLRVMFDPQQEAAMDSLFNHCLLTFMGVCPGNRVRLTKHKGVSLEGDAYLNYTIVLTYEDLDYNIFEFSFKTMLPKIREINILCFAGKSYPVPDILSLLRLSMLSIINRAPIKIHINGRPVKNKYYYKCIQDYHRMRYFMAASSTYPPVMLPNKAEAARFSEDFMKTIAKFPYCTTQDIFQQGSKKISGTKMALLRQVLWTEQDNDNVDPQDGLIYLDALQYPPQPQPVARPKQPAVRRKSSTPQQQDIFYDAL